MDNETGHVRFSVLAGNCPGTCACVGVLGRGVLVGRCVGAGVLKDSAELAKKRTAPNPPSVLWVACP